MSGASRHGLASWVKIREVGPRDGLQPEEPIPVEDRVRLVEALVAAGAGHVEVAAFVSPKAVPAMAGAAEVVSALLDLRREEANENSAVMTAKRALSASMSPNPSTIASAP